ncbi:Lysophospholipase-like protein 1 [Eufriesea mexicana]|uniref:lysophospholipase-like protein 1 n=1 Tax=Eufriesea mexicana TaxID=516756 RepID=UPI00083BD864|nr:PREDICTED: lysophospholipase-like protein 1 [Eufriesea mexicana]OAD56890.1 Lysophospholipase-like protein 1 [Eufriesea mexicana]
MAKLPKIDIVNATKTHSASLFLFHGSGATGSNFKEWIDILNRKELKFPHIKIIYPTAPLQSYTPNNRMSSHVWFDRTGIFIEAPEDTESINSICTTITEFIDNEISNGISCDRIVVAGFSMGGALSMYLSYKYKLSLAGCCAMSSFLNKNSLVYQHLKKHKQVRMPPLLQFHGVADNLIPIQWGEESYNNLKELGVNAQFVPLDNVDHELSKTGILSFKEWLTNILPEK